MNKDVCHVMLKKSLLTLFPLIFCFFLVCGVNNVAQATGGDDQQIGFSDEAGPFPRLEVDSLHQDYGEVIRGEKIVHSFILRNQGEGDLIIKKAKPG
ncbi:MAG: hypothetical protein KAJ45_00425 [Desulfobulbaceae bacterium]|nr:hypothetical protein [Desulfobulbaceae bacterium]